jgi:CheY-like chemotaxis protein
MKVMIVDDHSSVRRTIRTLLSDLVTTFYECGDAPEALSTYERHLPDWVLMDIKLGEMDGITAAGNIRAKYPDCKIVIVTNYDDEGLRAAAAKAGACAYVLKENLLELRSTISEQKGSTSQGVVI